MRPQSLWLLLGLALVLLVLCALARRRRAARALRDLARTHRLNYAPDDLIGVHERYCSLELIRQGHSRTASDLLYGVTEAGLLTVFRYTFELGFGAQRSGETRWMAVLETPELHDPWHAVPAAKDDPPGTLVGRYRICAEHARTLEAVRGSHLPGALDDLPNGARVEARGHLLAVAIPDRSDPADVAALIAAMCTGLHRATGTSQTSS